MHRQYTNELTPELLATMDQPPFTAEELAEMDEGVRSLIAEQEAFCRQHPVIAVYRLATAGCRTRRGGTGDEHNPEQEEGLKIRLEDGQWASVLTEGCIVTYPDGSSAKIISSAGSEYSLEGKGIALVGSLLDNGDEIISTPQDSSVLPGRAGVPVAEDFLAQPGA